MSGARWWRRRTRHDAASGEGVPDFVIVGTQKGGTSSLYAYLGEHPLVARAARKEVHYFDLHFEEGPAWYRSQFPSPGALVEQAAAAPRAGVRAERALTGEASPYYLYHPLAGPRMAHDLPAAKVIVLLRDPVARALSHYHHAVRLGFEDLSLEDALEQEAARLDGEQERLAAVPGSESFSHRQHSYTARGRYLEQLLRFADFRARGQLLVLRSEDLFADPQHVYDETLEFLGLPPWRIEDARARNTGAYDGPDAEVAARLRAYFAPFNDELYRYLGRDFGW